MASRYLQKFPVPQDFPEILRDFTREILRLQPKDIIDFGVKYFGALEKGQEFEWDTSNPRAPLPCDYPKPKGTGPFRTIKPRTQEEIEEAILNPPPRPLEHPTSQAEYMTASSEVQFKEAVSKAEASAKQTASHDTQVDQTRESAQKQQVANQTSQKVSSSSHHEESKQISTSSQHHESNQKVTSSSHYESSSKVVSSHTTTVYESHTVTSSTTVVQQGSNVRTEESKHVEQKAKRHDRHSEERKSQTSQFSVDSSEEAAAEQYTNHLLEDANRRISLQEHLA